MKKNHQIRLHFVAAIFIISNFVLGCATQPQTNSKATSTPTKATEQSSYTYGVYEILNVDSFLEKRNEFNQIQNEDERFIQHNKLLDRNPIIVKSLAGGQVRKGESVNVRIIRKPCVLFIRVIHRFSKGELASEIVEVDRKVKSISFKWIAGDEIIISKTHRRGFLIF